VSQAATVVEVEGNDLASTAQFISPFSFTLENVNEITLSTVLTHASISGSGDGTVDWYAFTHGGGAIILDIDGGIQNFDLELGIWDIQGHLIAANDDGGLLDAGSMVTFGELDPFINISSAPSGLYYIGVSSFPSAQLANFDAGGVGFSGGGYQLNISVGQVPEPTSAVLALLSCLTLSLRRKR
jgi:hypothetical protein